MRHYYIIGTYKHHFDPFWAVEPSVLLKSIGSSTQFDLGVKGCMMIECGLELAIEQVLVILPVCLDNY